MDFRKLVEDARTCRRFDESQPLRMDDMEWLVDCARLSPCGMNAQKLRFALVGAGKASDALFGMVRFAAAIKDGTPVAGERPTAWIVVLLPQDGGELNFYDVGIACQTIQLAATSRGWGCCMIKSFDAQAVTQLVKTPDGLKPGLVLALGVAREVRKIAPMPADGSCKYWRDGERVHHVPKRSIDELVCTRIDA